MITVKTKHRYLPREGYDVQPIVVNTSLCPDARMDHVHLIDVSVPSAMKDCMFCGARLHFQVSAMN